MSGFILQNPSMLYWLASLLVLGAFFRIRMIRRKREMRAFGADDSQATSSSQNMEPLRILLLALAMTCIIIALSRPAFNPQPKMIQREGRDLVFLLDVSKSMLAQDRLPSRLESAKLAIEECVQELKNHRLSLVLFAGSSSIACPLTQDRDFFLNSLEKANVDSVSHGGTRMGDALLKVCEKLFTGSNYGYRDIILLTDGGDHSSNLSKALKMMNEKKVNLITIGLGDEGSGARIPQHGKKSDYMLYKDKEVWTRLESQQLRSFTKKIENGAYLPLGIRKMNLADIYKRICKNEKKQTHAEKSVMVYDELYPWFIALALIATLFMVITPHSRHTRKLAKTALVLRFFSLFFPEAHAATSAKADKLYDSGNFKAALELYEKMVTHEQDAQLLFKKANTHYRLKEYPEAISNYQETLQLTNEKDLLSRIVFNLGTVYLKYSGNAQDSQESLHLLKSSIRNFRLILLDDKNNMPAAHNLELAKMALRKIKENQKANQKNNDPSTENQDDQEGDSEEGEESDMEEMEEEVGVSEDQELDTRDAENRLGDLQFKELPPPNDSPQDIIQQELEKQEQRKNTVKGKSQPVEKDW